MKIIETKPEIRDILLKWVSIKFSGNVFVILVTLYTVNKHMCPRHVVILKEVSRGKVIYFHCCGGRRVISGGGWWID